MRPRGCALRGAAIRPKTREQRRISNIIEGRFSPYPICNLMIAVLAAHDLLRQVAADARDSARAA